MSNILDYLGEKEIIIDIKPAEKKDIVSSILDHLIDAKRIKKTNKNDILDVIMQREEIGSTAIGGHIALPHARVNCVKDIVLSIAISKEGIDFESLDQDLVHVVILLISNQQEAGLHLKTLAYLAKLLRDKFFIQQLKDAKDQEQVKALIQKQQGIIG